MRILQLCYKPPFPPVDGGTLAIDSVTRGLLQAGCEVKVLTVCTDKHPFVESKVTDGYKAATGIEAVYIDTRVKPLAALVSLLCGESYHVKRYISSSFEKRLVEILNGEKFDIVHVESVFLTPYVSVVRKYSDAKVVLRAHNVECRIWRQLSNGEANPLKKWYLKHLSLALEHYERQHINDYDGVICITSQDADVLQTMGCRRPMTSVPFAIDPCQQFQNVQVEPLSLFHIGSMDWKPNVEAVDWFLSAVWPLVHSEMPDVKLYLAGRHMPRRLLDYRSDGVSIVGEVGDAFSFMAGKSLNIVPLLSGSGIRVKILEAMSMGKPVVATSVAARGIEYSEGVDILLADTPESFASQIKHCLFDNGVAESIGKSAVALVRNRYNIDGQTGKIMQFYKQILARTGTKQ